MHQCGGNAVADAENAINLSVNGLRCDVERSAAATATPSAVAVTNADLQPRTDAPSIRCRLPKKRTQSFSSIYTDFTAAAVEYSLATSWFGPRKSEGDDSGLGGPFCRPKTAASSPAGSIGGATLVADQTARMTETLAVPGSPLDSLQQRQQTLHQQQQQQHVADQESASVESRNKVQSVVARLRLMTPFERFVVLLHLAPTSQSATDDTVPSSATNEGPSIDRLSDMKLPMNALGNRAEIQTTIAWMRSHLTVDPQVSLPKQEVYEAYIDHCAEHSMKTLSTADFGKVIKQVYPEVRPRRLGTRGNSRYCYAGLSFKYSLKAPVTPDLGALIHTPSPVRLVDSVSSPLFRRLSIADNGDIHAQNQPRPQPPTPAVDSEASSLDDLALRLIVQPWVVKIATHGQQSSVSQSPTSQSANAKKTSVVTAVARLLIDYGCIDVSMSDDVATAVRRIRTDVAATTNPNNETNSATFTSHPRLSTLAGGKRLRVDSTGASSQISHDEVTVNSAFPAAASSTPSAIAVTASTETEDDAFTTTTVDATRDSKLVELRQLLIKNHRQHQQHALHHAHYQQQRVMSGIVSQSSASVVNAAPPPPQPPPSMLLMQPTLQRTLHSAPSSDVPMILDSGGVGSVVTAAAASGNMASDDMLFVANAAVSHESENVRSRHSSSDAFLPQVQHQQQPVSHHSLPQRPQSVVLHVPPDVGSVVTAAPTSSLLSLAEIATSAGSGSDDASLNRYLPGVAMSQGGGAFAAAAAQIVPLANGSVVGQSLMQQQQQPPQQPFINMASTVNGNVDVNAAIVVDGDDQFQPQTASLLGDESLMQQQQQQSQPLQQPHSRHASGQMGTPHPPLHQQPQPLDASPSFVDSMSGAATYGSQTPDLTPSMMSPRGTTPGTPATPTPISGYAVRATAAAISSPFASAASVLAASQRANNNRSRHHSAQARLCQRSRHSSGLCTWNGGAAGGGGANSIVASTTALPVPALAPLIPQTSQPAPPLKTAFNGVNGRIVVQQQQVSQQQPVVRHHRRGHHQFQSPPMQHHPAFVMAHETPSYCDPSVLVAANDGGENGAVAVVPSSAGPGVDSTNTFMRHATGAYVVTGPSDVGNRATAADVESVADDGNNFVAFQDATSPPYLAFRQSGTDLSMAASRRTPDEFRFVLNALKSEECGGSSSSEVTGALDGQK